MNRSPALLMTFALATLLAVATPARADDAAVTGESPPLRVLSWNLHGVPLIRTRRAARLAAMPAAVVALERRSEASDPSTASAPIDVLALQEVWLDADAATLTEAFRAAGWPHARRAPAGGLLTLSRGAITEARFTAFDYPGKPLKPWHADWFGGKGFDRMQVETAAGVVELVNTHLQARFGSTEYDTFQLTQAIQLGAALGPTPGKARPLIAVGDFNSRQGHASTDTLLAMTGLTVTGAGMNIDLVLTRSGGARSPGSRAARHVLTEPVELPGGAPEPLSDHPGVLATIRFKATPATAEPPRASLAADHRERVRARLKEARDRVRRDRRLTALAVTLIAGALGLLLRREMTRRRRVALLAVTLPALTLLLVQLLVDQPATLEALEQALKRVGAG